MTCRRDRLPFGVPGQYFHKQKILSYAKTKVARFLQPIVVIKDNDGGGGASPINVCTVASNSLPPVIFPPSMR